MPAGLGGLFPLDLKQAGAALAEKFLFFKKACLASGIKHWVREGSCRGLMI